MPNPEGRPTLMTEETLKKLESCFLIGCSDREACFIAEISHQTLYNYQTANPEYVERKAALKDMQKYKARRNIYTKIDQADTEVSKWYLERKAKDEFSLKNETELTGKNGKDLIPHPIMNVPSNNSHPADHESQAENTGDPGRDISQQDSVDSSVSDSTSPIGL